MTPVKAVWSPSRGVLRSKESLQQQGYTLAVTTCIPRNRGNQPSVGPRCAIVVENAKSVGSGESETSGTMGSARSAKESCGASGQV